MLDIALKYKEQVNQKFLDTWYDDRYKFYYNNGRSVQEEPDNDWNRRAFVSLNTSGEVIGYISYSIDNGSGSAYNFGAINFSNDKVTFGRDLRKVINDIFTKFNMYRMEFSVVIGNPIEESYDKVVEKYGGRIIGRRHEVVKLIDNRIYDDKMYEILRDNYLSAVR